MNFSDSPRIEVVSWPVDEAPQEVVDMWRAQRATHPPTQEADR